MISGLSSQEAAMRLEKFGENIIVAKKKRSLVLEFLKGFKDLMVLILIAAAVISIIVGDLKEAIVILAIVIINATISFIQEFRAEKAVEALQKMVAPKAHVMRDGQVQEIEARLLVPGDLIILNEGDKIPADAKLIEENELQTQEAVLTGESTPVEKNPEGSEPENLVFMGTNVAHGRGKAIVTATGMQTKFGKIAHLTSVTKKEKSPLERELDHISVFVGKITLVIAAALFGVGFFIQGHPLTETLIFAAAVAVAAVPEGLLATVTIALALGVQRLAKKKAIVKQLSAVETLGATTVILTDKTGTLTKNEMTVREFQGLTSEVKPQALTLVCTLCNNATLHGTQIIGDPTEGALLTFSAKQDANLDELNKIYSRLYELPFDSTLKRMSVVCQNETTKKVFVFAKGAPDSILPLCTNLTEQQKNEFLRKNEEMAGRALRVLALAYRELDHEPHKKYKRAEVEHDLIFVGLVGMIDPPREEVKEAVALMKQAGIRAYIVTGDHGLTAAAIARECGLAGENAHIITGKELDELDDETLKKYFQEKNREMVFARVNPEHKLRLANILKSLNEVVAMTGDGVNDAPALKRADIGISMGMGTDVTKEAANMVLADDSFATIVHAIEEGRAIYENMRKFIMYIFSSNIGEVITVFTAIMIGLSPPLTAILILLVNLGTDFLPALALGVETPDPENMRRPPRDPSARILQKPYILRFMFIGLLMGLITLAFYALDLRMENNYIESTSFAFAIFVIAEMFNTWNARSEQKSAFSVPFFSNRFLLFSVAISLLFTVAVTELPLFQAWFETEHLKLEEWAMAVGGGVIILLAEEIRKYVTRIKTRRPRVA